MITSLTGFDGSFGLGKIGVGDGEIPVAEEN